MSGTGSQWGGQPATREGAGLLVSGAPPQLLWPQLAEPSLVNQTVFRERACARKRGRGGRKNTVWPNWPGFRGISYLTSGCDQSDYQYAVII